jgi:oligopeptide/dipeptide ABC transporter ATP-binding protein
MPVLQVDSLSVSFRTSEGFLPVVRDVALTLEAGETLAIVGESGSGKSVTSLALVGLLSEKAKVEGKFMFAGEPYFPQQGKVRGHGLSVIFQNPMSSLNPVMKVGLQVAEPLVYLRGMSRLEARQESLKLFAEVGLPSEGDFFSRYPHQLSGGMRQRVMIAVALACDPKVLIADEPTTALDVTIQAQILKLLKRLQVKRQMSLILVTHDMSVVRSVADRVAVMYAGQFVEVGSKDQLLESPSHPYTQALLRSIPRLERDVPDQLLTISGRPPAPGEISEGCFFAPRCDLVEARCREERPELTWCQGVGARCFLRQTP